MSTKVDVISNVRDVLIHSAKVGKTITFGEVEKKVGEEIGAWKNVLDSIHEDCVAKGYPDLTAIVIYNATGYPAFLNDGAKDKRSKRFNPNDLEQRERWEKEVARVFSWCQNRAE
jgi:hypothetical protein